MKFWEAIMQGLINCGSYEKWQLFLHWYVKKYGDYCWEPQPIGDHIKVWYSKEQQEDAREHGSTDTCDKTHGLLAFDSHDDHMVNEKLYEEYLRDTMKM